VWVAEPATIILYARVSSSKPRSSLEKPEKLLKSKYPNARFISDIASGFNQNRRGYRTFLELAIDGNPLHLVATTSDRITRTGFSLIKRSNGTSLRKWIIELSGGKLELLEETEPIVPNNLIQQPLSLSSLRLSIPTTENGSAPRSSGML